MRDRQRGGPAASSSSLISSPRWARTRGEGGSYFQRVPLREATRVDAGSSLVVRTGRGDLALETDRDALLFPVPRAAQRPQWNPGDVFATRTELYR